MAYEDLLGNTVSGYESSMSSSGVNYLPQAQSSISNALSGFASSTGIGNLVNNVASNSFVSGSDIAAASPSGASGSSLLSTISDLFLRSVIIILGFIFTAVALSMFKTGMGK